MSTKCDCCESEYEICDLTDYHGEWLCSDCVKQLDVTRRECCECGESKSCGNYNDNREWMCEDCYEHCPLDECELDDCEDHHKGEFCDCGDWKCPHCEKKRNK